MDYSKKLTLFEMHPISWTWCLLYGVHFKHRKRGFYMSKLSYENKVKIYRLKNQGESAINWSKKYNIRWENVNYMVRIQINDMLNKALDNKNLEGLILHSD